MQNDQADCSAKLPSSRHVKEFETQNIYAAIAPRNDVRINDCYAMETLSLRSCYDAAVRDLDSVPTRDDHTKAAPIAANSIRPLQPNWR